MIEWLTDTMLATGALIALVLLVRKPVARWFGPGVAYSLWALPLVRLFLPPLVLPVKHAAPAAAPVVGDAGATPVAAVAAAPVEPSLITPLPWAQIALAVWLAGAVAFLGYRTWTYFAARRTLLKDAVQVATSGKVRIVESPAVEAPVAFGVIDKIVALPLDFFETADAETFDFALDHELEHHAANDLAANLVVQPLLAMHWFNPLGWAAWRAMRSDQEAACDARVVAGRDRAERARYGEAIAAYAVGPRMDFAAPMAGPLSGEKPIIHRLKCLTRSEETARRTTAGKAAVAIAALALPATATVTYAAIEVPVAFAASDETEAVAPKNRQHVVIHKVERDVTSGDDEGETYRNVIEEDGKRFEIVTDRPLSDDELRAEIAKAEANMPRPSVPPVPPVVGAAPPVPPVPPVPPQARMQMRVFKAYEDGSTSAQHIEPVELECGGHHFVIAVAGGEPDEKQIERYETCVEGTATRAAMHGLTMARDAVARDMSISKEIREEVLRDLDQEIAELRRKS
ncbi:MAG: M56 family metallopeptidase [Sphingomonadaceae bacterium]